MKDKTSIWRRGAWLLGGAMLFVHQAVQACPGCQQANTEGGKTALNGISLGFGFGVLFMLFAVFSVLGALGFLMYRACRTLAAQQQLAMAAEDADRGFRAPTGALPAY